MTEKEWPDFIPSPPAEDVAAPHGYIDPPEKIVADLQKTEREIAAETMSVLRSRHEQAKRQWEKLHADKEQEILRLKMKLAETEDRMTLLQQQIEEEREIRIEQTRQTTREMCERRESETKKWEAITDEVKRFREEAREAQGRFNAEQEKLNRLKKDFALTEQQLKERLRSKEEEVFEINEHTLRKEGDWLKAQNAREEKINALQEQLSALQQALSEERLQQGKLNEKKDSDIARLQKGLQDLVISLNAERLKREEAEAKIIKQQNEKGEIEDALRRMSQEKEKEILGWKKAVQEEQTKGEKAKQGFKEAEAALLRNSEEQIARITKAMRIVEQQLAEEQRLRKEAEEILNLKEGEIQHLLSEKEEIMKEWKKMMSTEEDNGRKQQAALLEEHDRFVKAKEEEVASLKEQVKSSQAALAETNKLLGIEKEAALHALEKNKRLELERQRLIEQMENKERDWQTVLIREQELLQKQIEELRAKTDAQIQSREMEITRLNEDLSMLNGQLMEIRQKFSLEKNENNNRLARIQELEIHAKSLTERLHQERTEWDFNLRALQEKMEEQRKNSAIYLEETENQYKKDIEAYKKKIDRLNAKLDESRSTPNNNE